jgi:hypothetical protein
MNRSLINRPELALRAQRKAAKRNRAGQTLAKAPAITKAALPTPDKVTRLKLR